jgi:hypothetical protein
MQVKNTFTFTKKCSIFVLEETMSTIRITAITRTIHIAANNGNDETGG